MDRKNVAAVYELTPMQTGMLFHSRYGEDPGVYLTQFHCRLEGPLDRAAFERAWQNVVSRHPVLRSSFHWQKLDKPLQVVHREVEVPIEIVEHRDAGKGVDEGGFAPVLEAFLAADRHRPLDLEQAPLLRLMLFVLGDERHHLVWSHHHLLLDGWSVGLVLGEVFALYRTFAAGRELVLPTPRPYKDFILWLQQRDHDAAEAHWRELLAGFDEPTPVALEPPAIASKESGYERVFRTFGEALTSELETLARRQRITLNTLFQGAWALLLGRLAGRREAVFGATVAGRPPELDGVERMVGLFINTLPVRACLVPELAAGDWLRRLQEQQAKSRAHEWTPLFEIQKLSAIAPGTPLFESLVIFENLPTERLAEGDGDAAQGPRIITAGFVQRSNYALTLAVSPRDGELSVRLGFPTARYAHSAIARLLRHLETVLRRIAANPERPLAALSLLSPGEEQQILREWKPAFPLGERGPENADATLPALVRAQAERTPDLEAAIVEGREVSYAELVARAERLAHHLRQRGVRAETRVGVCVERSLDSLVAILGVLTAGGAYVPLDPSWPDERLAFVARDAGLALSVTQERLAPRLSAAPTLLLDAAQDDTTSDADAADDARALPAIDPRQLAYVIYTSGSTGRPKGAGVTHRQLARKMLVLAELFALGPGQRQLHFVSLAFDVAGEEIFVPLLSGAAIVIEPGAQAATPSEMLALAGRRGVSKINLPASYWHQLVDELEARQRPVPESLEILVTGAESPSPEKLRRWLDLAPGVERSFNVYGPTEATVMASAKRLTAADAARERLSIGRPLADTALFVGDPEMRLLPGGAVGELLIGGSGVGRGYLGRPAATAERFVPDPFSATAGARLYRTGDLALFRGDGTLEFAGRTDHQVKVRGFRIELGEIAEALRRYPRVDDAAVLLREDRPGEKRITAYVVAAAEVSLAALRAALAEQLPEYMVPAAFVFLDALPLTANQKLDRRALPAPGDERPELEQAYAPPRTPLERFLAELWQGILGLERVGIHDHFFELGGDSIKGAVFINRLEAELSEYVYVVALFDSPTVAGFAAHLGGHCPAAVEKRFGAESVVREAATTARVAGRLDASHLAHVRSLVEPLAPFPAAATPNPPAVFVLSPPRSGSTLFRVMLAGHPRIFAPPELDLLSFNTLAERRAEFEGRFSFWLEGAIRAVMELEGLDAETARARIEAAEAAGTSTRDFYQKMQERLAGRLLVDKTPAYALDLEILRRAERDFEDARFIHLLRHPGAMVHSFEKARIDELFFRYEHPYDPRQLGELTWNLCHENIGAFLAEVPAERQTRVRYEELVSEPERVIGEVCAFLGLEPVAAMLDPYGAAREDGQSRMTDGIHPLAKMLGDVKFHQHRKIDPRAAWRFVDAYGEDFLGQMTWGLAAELGYEKPASWTAAERQPLVALPRDARGGGSFPLSLPQERLWVMHRLAPVGAGYSLPTVFDVRGPLDEAALRAAAAALVTRHETLRTTLAAVDGEPRQVVAPRDAAPTFVRADLTALPSGRREKSAEALLTLLVRRPFDLERGPLFYLVLAQLGDEERVLLVNLHHAVSDGWSQSVLAEELTRLYAALAARRQPDLPALPVQYADFAAWQRRELSGERLEARLTAWRELLAGAPEALELPTDRPRPPVPSFRGARLPVRFGSAALAGLRRAGGAREATLFMTLLAAFGTLLARYSRQDDVVIGSPVAGRPRRELEGLVGFFVNTLALRVTTAGDPIFSELLERVRTMALAAYRHQDLPFEKLVEEMNPRRDTRHQPLFQAAFTMRADRPESAPRPSGETTTALSELRFEPRPIDSQSSKFDLTLALGERADGLAGSLEFSSDLFDRATIQRMIRHFGNLLEAAAADPSRRLWDLPLLDAVEQRQVTRSLSTRRDDARDEEESGTLDDLFAARAAARPVAPALRFAGVSVSYGELAERAFRLAQHLRAEGALPEAVVGVFLERGADLVTAILGVTLAGAAYLPLDPGQPPARVAELLSDAAAPLLVTTAALAERLASEARASEALRARRVVRLDRDAGAIAARPPVRPEPRGDLDRLAYVIYTSGSTGKPKGTLVTHRQVTRLFHVTAPLFDFSAADVWTLFHSAAFDFSVWEMWGALLYGGCLVVVPFEVSRAPRAFAELLEREKVTVLNQTPSAFRQLVAAEQERGPLQAPLRPLQAPLRFVILGGEALDVASLAPWWERHDDRQPRLVNMYGITETTVHVTRRELSKADLKTPWRRAVGHALADLELYVLDRRGRPVPLGVTGEIHVGGAGVTRGYLGRPALTAARFVPHPLSDQPGRRLYKSGDLGRFLSVDVEGTNVPGTDLEHRGRLDHQVKIRGFRIELGEIEAMLQAHEAVRDAVALPDAEGDRLLAFVVPGGPATPLRRRLEMERRGEIAPGDLFELQNGLVIAHLNRSESEFLEREIFHDAAYLRHGIEIGAGDVVFDVGANIGLFSLQAAARGARVFAFEPIPPVYECLRRNFELHGVSGRAIPRGLAAASGTAPFTYYPQVSVISGRYAEAGQERRVVERYLRGQDGEVTREGLDELLDQRLESETVEAELETVSSRLAALGLTRLDLLKIDVEKSELEVLRGIAEEDWPKIRQVVVEVHDLDGRLATVETLLRGHGFELVVDEDPQLEATGLYSVYARRPATNTAQREATTRREASTAGLGWSSPDQLAAELRGAARQLLPEYMLPARYVFLDRWPLTTNGKLDRDALEQRARETRTLPRTKRQRAPRDEIERCLATIFAAVLGPAVDGEVGIDDDFFALGGHSLLAVRLVAEIRSRFARDLPLAALFRGATVARLAEVLRTPESGAARSPLVEIQDGTSAQRPLFCVHPAGGHALCYAPLARALGPERTVIGIEARGIYPQDEPRERIEDMAAAYLEAVRQRQPEGPYALLGWSLGGLVAHAMACRLEELGERVEPLVLVDVWARPPVQSSAPGAAERLAAALEGVVDLAPEDLADAQEDAALERLLQAARSQGVLPEGFTTKDARRYLALYEAGQRAVQEWRPRRYGGAALLLRARDEPAAAQADPALGWHDFIGGELRVERVPGDHRTMMTAPHAGHIAALLAKLGELGNE